MAQNESNQDLHTVRVSYRLEIRQFTYLNLHELKNHSKNTGPIVIFYGK
jgi:hypothetical protein